MTILLYYYTSGSLTLVDDVADEPLWVSDYMAFTEELYRYFGPYDQVANAEVELENLVMKDNHKATRFFIEFYRLSSLLEYNDSALHHRAYLALPKRIKDEMVHFDKPRSLNNLQDLVQKIDQRYWEQRGELTHEPHSVPKTEAKQDKSSNQNRGSQNNDRCQGQGSGNSNANTVGCKHCTRAGYKPNAFPSSVFARTSFQSMLTVISYFPEFFLYLLSLWAIVCSVSFTLYRRSGVVLRNHTRESTLCGAGSRRADFESARSRTVWRPNASCSRHLRICMSQGRAPLLSAFCH
jgi:hypothetical protein